jgi:hypothetical protein
MRSERIVDLILDVARLELANQNQIEEEVQGRGSQRSYRTNRRDERQFNYLVKSQESYYRWNMGPG